MINRSFHFGAALREASSQPPPPCERYVCPHFQRCKTEALACEAFHAYVVTGRSRPGDNPTRERYLKIYKEEDAQ